MKEVLGNSKLRITAGSDAGETILERNFERMKSWKKSQAEALFDEDKQLMKSSKAIQDDHKTISNSRKLIRQSLKSINVKAEMKDDKLSGAQGRVLATMANKLTSKENVLKKFKNAEVEYPIMSSTICGSTICGSAICGSTICGSTICGSTVCSSTICGSTVCGSTICGSTICG